MLDALSNSVTGATPTLGVVLLCTVSSLAFGFAVSAIYMFKNKYSKSLALTLVFIPAIVQIIIMLVNGNIGAGVAVAGAFSLVRFRSMPGNARDIGCLFFAMAIGFVTGIGHLFYALIFLLLIGGGSVLLTLTHFGQGKADNCMLRITIPENLDFDGVFDDVFAKYTKSVELDKVKTTNMGSLYELTYSVQLQSASATKAFLDDLRCRNGNLGIQLSRELIGREEL